MSRAQVIRCGVRACRVPAGRRPGCGVRGAYTGYRHRRHRLRVDRRSGGAHSTRLRQRRATAHPHRRQGDLLGGAGVPRLGSAGDTGVRAGPRGRRIGRRAVRRRRRHDPVHLGNHRRAQGCQSHPPGIGGRYRRRRRRLAMDPRRHRGPRSAAVPPAWVGARRAGLAADRLTRRAYRQAATGALCRRGRHPVLRRSHRVVAHRRRRAGGAGVAPGSPTGFGQRSVAHSGLPPHRRADRQRPYRALRHERNLDHPQHARRRRTPPRVGRPAGAGSPHPVADRGRAGGAARRRKHRTTAGSRPNVVQRTTSTSRRQPPRHGPTTAGS